MVHLNDDERNLLLVQGLLTFGDSLASIFVTIFIFAHSDVRTVVFFNMISYTTLFIFFTLSGLTLRKLSSGFLIRLSLIGSAAFYFLLFLLRQEAVHAIIPLAILDGAAAGTFWSAFNLNQYIFTAKNTRVKYFGFGAAINNFLSAAGPLIGGGIITILGKNIFLGLSVGYTTLFLFVSVVLSAGALFVGHLPEHELIHFSYRDLLTHARSRAWKLVLSQHAIIGFFDVCLPLMTGILTYVILRQEFAVGTVQTARAIIMSVGAIISVRLLEREGRTFWIGVAGVSAAIIGFALLQNIPGLIFYTIVMGFAWPFLGTWTATVYFHTLDRLGQGWINKYHLLLERDMSLGMSRIVSYVLLYFFLEFGDQVKLAREVLFVLPVFPIILGILFAVQRKQDVRNVTEYLAEEQSLA